MNIKEECPPGKDNIGRWNLFESLNRQRNLVAECPLFHLTDFSFPYCQAQLQLQLQLELRLALIPISPATHPPIHPPEKVFEHHLDCV